MSRVQKILLIEPDYILASLHSQALRAVGYEVASVSDAAQAMAAVESRPDLIIMELQLVTHNGIELLYEIRSYPDLMTLPVIVHSSIPAAEFYNKRTAQQLRVQSYLYKPTTSLETLIQTIDTILAAAPA